MMDGDVGALSGGWKMRVALARILLMRPDVMLLDEPSNHLDLESLIWLEEFLGGYDGALLMTSHDREFMNRIINKVIEIDGGSLTSFAGDYEFYEGQRALTVPAAVDEVSAARRLRALFGSEFAAAAREVDTANERLRVFGYVAGPELARSQHDLQMLAVNGRVIRDRQLAHAIRLAYDDALPEGRHPCYALQLEIRPEDVDVNVHPGKLEVRFRDLREVHDLVHSAVRAALRTAPEIPSLVSYRPPAFAAQPTLGLGSVQARETAHPTSPRRDAPDPETEWLTLLAERYAVLREGQSLVLVDLSCFVQGVLAARMRTELQASTSLPSRPLLFPVRIECVDEAAAQRLGADLQALGLTLNPLGPKTLALRALPRVAPEVDAERLGRALADGGVSTSDDLAAALAAAVTIPALAHERTQWWQRWLAQASEAGIAPELFIRRLDAAALEQLTGRRNG
jgi:DNA mismatch repair ATPase MutL